ncbi:addiction module protein [sulfur-oxidizing endosymbiont of Gigantopelta aegis]|uniref:addiction module protein n=1 Tax=sulfur-oxidizing endosymbiont of Gigantopelta aegis TaxID=2794934 RepID=UPI0018DD1AD8|nr:addiction module protein [sulfur-oxidizing endosymbiont of Gigantopelta aegis]
MEIQELTVSERIILAEKLWNSVLNDESEMKLTENQEIELDRRLDAFASDNDFGSPWSEVKEQQNSVK